MANPRAETHSLSILGVCMIGDDVRVATHFSHSRSEILDAFVLSMPDVYIDTGGTFRVFHDGLAPATLRVKDIKP